MPADSKKRKRLGRGLEVLLAASGRSAASAGKQGGGAADAPAEASGAAVLEIDIDSLRPGRYQPRASMPGESLAELAESIRQQGILQPLIVRRLPDGESEIVAGERRWRAARLAGLARVPVILREFDDPSALAVALIENLQREDLNAMDQARSLRRLSDEFQLTHADIARALGRSRASVTNLLRLLDLDEEVQGLVAGGTLDFGHARALLPLAADAQRRLGRRAAKTGLSVRQVEQAVRRNLEAAQAERRRPSAPDLQTRWLGRQIEQELGARVSIKKAADGYGLNLAFGGLTELEATLDKLIELVRQVRDAAGPRARELGGDE